MKTLLILFLLFCAVIARAGRGPELTPDDLSRYSVFLNQSIPSTEKKTVDNFVLRGIDGKEVREVAKFRFGRDEAGQTTTYVLVEPGRHDATFRYHQRKKRLVGYDTFDAEVTREVNVKPGLYEMRGQRDKDFAVIWVVRRDSGELVVPPTKSLVREDKGSGLIPIPIPIK